MRRLKLIFILLKKSVEGWGEDNAAQLAAAIAYYTIFSLSPLLIIAVSVAEHFFDKTAAKTQLIAQIGGFVGQGTADFVQTLLENSSQLSTGIIASIIGVIVLLAGASGVFYQIQFALNRIWKVPKKLPSSLLKTLKYHTLSFLVVLGIGTLFLIILIASTVASVLVGSVAALSQNGFLFGLINFFVLFVTMTSLFATLFRVIPDKAITWGDVWLGASVTGLLFVLGRYAISFYLTFSKSAVAYGAAGSLVVLLIWIFYSVQIFLFGAEFTHAYSMRLGSHPGAETVSISSLDGKKSTQEE